MSRLERIAEALLAIEATLAELSPGDRMAVLTLVVREREADPGPPASERSASPKKRRGDATRSAILAALARGPRSLLELRTEIGVAQSTVSRALASMQAEGRVVRQGSGSSARWGVAK